MDLDDDCERRKSSILKPPKVRQPLHDLNFGSNDEDTADMRRRRVSFAGVKGIKEFNAEAESILICGIPAYEEEFSASSDSSQVLSMKSEVSSSRIIVYTGKEEQLSFASATDNGDDELELTQCISPQIKAVPSHGKDSLVCSRLETTDTPNPIEHNPQEILSRNLSQFNLFNQNSMDVTLGVGAVPNSISQVKENLNTNSTVNHNLDMEMTKSVSLDGKTSFTCLKGNFCPVTEGLPLKYLKETSAIQSSSVNYNSDMEMTKGVTVDTKTNWTCLKENFPFNVKIPQYEEETSVSNTSVNCNMEVTKGVAQGYKFVQDISNDRYHSFTKDEPSVLSQNFKAKMFSPNITMNYNYDVEIIKAAVVPATDKISLKGSCSKEGISTGVETISDILDMTKCVTVSGEELSLCDMDMTSVVFSDIDKPYEETIEQNPGNSKNYSNSSASDSNMAFTSCVPQNQIPVSNQNYIGPKNNSKFLDNSGMGQINISSLSKMEITAAISQGTSFKMPKCSEGLKRSLSSPKEIGVLQKSILNASNNPYNVSKHCVDQYLEVSNKSIYQKNNCSTMEFTSVCTNLGFRENEISGNEMKRVSDVSISREGWREHESLMDLTLQSPANKKYKIQEESGGIKAVCSKRIHLTDMTSLEEKTNFSVDMEETLVHSVRNCDISDIANDPYLKNSAMHLTLQTIEGDNCNSPNNKHGMKSYITKDYKTEDILLEKDTTGSDKMEETLMQSGEAVSTVNPVGGEVNKTADLLSQEPITNCTHASLFENIENASNLGPHDVHEIKITALSDDKSLNKGNNSVTSEDAALKSRILSGTFESIKNMNNGIVVKPMNLNANAEHSECHVTELTLDPLVSLNENVELVSETNEYITANNREMIHHSESNITSLIPESGVNFINTGEAELTKWKSTSDSVRFFCDGENSLSIPIIRSNMSPSKEVCPVDLSGKNNYIARNTPADEIPILEFKEDLTETKNYTEPEISLCFHHDIEDNFVPASFSFPFSNQNLSNKYEGDLEFSHDYSQVRKSLSSNLPLEEDYKQKSEVTADVFRAATMDPSFKDINKDETLSKNTRSVEINEKETKLKRFFGNTNEENLDGLGTEVDLSSEKDNSIRAIPNVREEINEGAIKLNHSQFVGKNIDHFDTNLTSVNASTQRGSMPSTAVNLTIQQDSCNIENHISVGKKNETKLIRRSQFFGNTGEENISMPSTTIDLNIQEDSCNTEVHLLSEENKVREKKLKRRSQFFGYTDEENISMPSTTIDLNIQEDSCNTEVHLLSEESKVRETKLKRRSQFFGNTDEENMTSTAVNLSVQGNSCDGENYLVREEDKKKETKLIRSDVFENTEKNMNVPSTAEILSIEDSCNREIQLLREENKVEDTKSDRRSHVFGITEENIILPTIVSLTVQENFCDTENNSSSDKVGKVIKLEGRSEFCGNTGENLEPLGTDHLIINEENSQSRDPPENNFDCAHTDVLQVINDSLSNVTISENEQALNKESNDSEPGANDHILQGSRTEILFSQRTKRRSEVGCKELASKSVSLPTLYETVTAMSTENMPCLCEQDDIKDTPNADIEKDDYEKMDIDCSLEEDSITTKRQSCGIDSEEETAHTHEESEQESTNLVHYKNEQLHNLEIKNTLSNLNGHTITRAQDCLQSDIRENKLDNSDTKDMSIDCSSSKHCTKNNFIPEANESSRSKDKIVVDPKPMKIEKAHENTNVSTSWSSVNIEKYVNPIETVVPKMSKRNCTSGFPVPVGYSTASRISVSGFRTSSIRPLSSASRFSACSFRNSSMLPQISGVDKLRATRRQIEEFMDDNGFKFSNYTEWYKPLYNKCILLVVHTPLSYMNQNTRFEKVLFMVNGDIQCDIQGEILCYFAEVLLKHLDKLCLTKNLTCMKDLPSFIDKIDKHVFKIKILLDQVLYFRRKTWSEFHDGILSFIIVDPKAFMKFDVNINFKCWDFSISENCAQVAISVDNTIGTINDNEIKRLFSSIPTLLDNRFWYYYQSLHKMCEKVYKNS